VLLAHAVTLPPTLAGLALLGLAVVAAAIRRGRLALGLAVAALTGVYAWSTPAGAWLSLAAASYGHPPVDAGHVPGADAIVVLGGGMVARGTEPDGGTRFLGDLGRVETAARLYRDGHAPLVVATGGNAASFSRGAMTEAEGMAELLRRLGVPAPAIRTETASRNTAENAANTAALLAGLGLHDVILVTSDYHMARAVRLFAGQGLAVTPAATSSRHPVDPASAAAWLPSWSAYNDSGIALREIAGRLAAGLGAH
jgi:uncharacterized SAM-binding protein YcdF (DUF218 family)